MKLRICLVFPLVVYRAQMIMSFHQLRQGWYTTVNALVEGVFSEVFVVITSFQSERTYWANIFFFIIGVGDLRLHSQ